MKSVVFLLVGPLNLLSAERRTKESIVPGLANTVDQFIFVCRKFSYIRAVPFEKLWAMSYLLKIPCAGDPEVFAIP